MSAISKKELIASIAESTGQPKTATSKVIDAFFKNITDHLASGDTVTLMGFGTFLTKPSPARKGRNPSTGQPMDIPASTKCKFKPGKTLKDAVNR